MSADRITDGVPTNSASVGSQVVDAAQVDHRIDDLMQMLAYERKRNEQLQESLTASGCEDWRTVESGMPPLEQWVYIYLGGAPRHKDRRQFVAKRTEYGHKRRGWTTDQDDDWGVANGCVTHWKPLQENPK